MEYYLAWVTLMNYVSCLYEQGIIDQKIKESMEYNLMELKEIVLDADLKEEE
jgi:hypothetical protein